MHAGLSQAKAKGMAVSQLAKMLQGQAAVDAMAYSVAVTAAIVVVAIFLTLFMRNKKKFKKQDMKGAKNNNEGELAILE